MPPSSVAFGTTFHPTPPSPFTGLNAIKARQAAQEPPSIWSQVALAGPKPTSPPKITWVNGKKFINGKPATGGRRRTRKHKRHHTRKRTRKN